MVMMVVVDKMRRRSPRSYLKTPARLRVRLRVIRESEVVEVDAESRSSRDN